MSVIVIFQAMVIAGVLFTLITLASTINYRITAEALEILLMGMVARRIRLSDIEEVHRRGAFLHENWSGLRFWNAVTIRRRTGILKNLVISPEEPDQFVEKLSRSVRGSNETGRQ